MPPRRTNTINTAITNVNAPHSSLAMWRKEEADQWAALCKFWSVDDREHPAWAQNKDDLGTYRDVAHKYIGDFTGDVLCWMTKGMVEHLGPSAQAMWIHMHMNRHGVVEADYELNIPELPSTAEQAILHNVEGATDPSPPPPPQPKPTAAKRKKPLNLVSKVTITMEKAPHHYPTCQNCGCPQKSSSDSMDAIEPLPKQRKTAAGSKKTPALLATNNNNNGNTANNDDPETQDQQTANDRSSQEKSTEEGGNKQDDKEDEEEREYCVTRDPMNAMSSLMDLVEDGVYHCNANNIKNKAIPPPPPEGKWLYFPVACEPCHQNHMKCFRLPGISKKCYNCCIKHGKCCNVGLLDGCLHCTAVKSKRTKGQITQEIKALQDHLKDLKEECKEAPDTESESEGSGEDE
ncbi:hypothetical protein DACRYDRAFT_18929 [Dacryopinax primogenitus]|uniref:Uncharacterized protein n=1 Tax=Dacryopinax primogenitus (strain DJM 731) TaxID=1858805 RepID=M5FPQ0_DACPD|nr:uncharacterized protein DACRYDRAFT_18929 [Dacryopinax primogenitus]EJT97228.1 hypothetical protein DACRYDRAFT_18929 [Dacryopinax primogenitus]